MQSLIQSGTLLEIYKRFLRNDCYLNQALVLKCVTFTFCKDTVIVYHTINSYPIDLVKVYFCLVHAMLGSLTKFSQKLHEVWTVQQIKLNTTLSCNYF